MRRKDPEELYYSEKMRDYARFRIHGYFDLTAKANGTVDVQPWWVKNIISKCEQEFRVQDILQEIIETAYEDELTELYFEFDIPSREDYLEEKGE